MMPQRAVPKTSHQWARAGSTLPPPAATGPSRTGLWITVAVVLLARLGGGGYYAIASRGPDPETVKARALAEEAEAKRLKAEEEVFRRVRTEVTDKLGEEAKDPSNRYYDGSPIYPGHFKQDWNRSYTLEPDGAPVGAVVLLFVYGLIMGRQGRAV